MSVQTSVLIIVLVFTSVYCDDEYILESQEQCKAAKDVFSCAKYNVLNYLDVVGKGSILETNSSAPVQLVKIEDPDQDESMFEGTSRAMPTDGEFTKFFKFMQRRADKFLRSQGVAIPLPSGFRVIEEDSTAVESRGVGGHKKKGVVSILTLFGVFKIKVLVGILLVGMFFIKKVILLGALVLPSILHNLKANCKHMPHHAVHHGHGEEHFHEEPYYGNYGNSNNNGAYSKEYERRFTRAQAAHAQQAFTVDSRSGQSTQQKYPIPFVPSASSTGFRPQTQAANMPSVKIYNVMVQRHPNSTLLVKP